MKETILATCEQQFVLKAISENKRYDGRLAYDFRHISILFGSDKGCCTVELGKTKLLAQVTCETTVPKPSRPNEGELMVNLELSPMAAPHFEAGRLSDFGVELSRLLERCIKDSRCVDLESLCILAEKLVWLIRLDIHVLNHDGNIIDCASIAAITALLHFRKPDVSLHGEDVTVHKPEERNPVPLSIHHMPICITFAFFEEGKFLMVDPTDMEERVMEGKLVLGMNSYREICTLHMAGKILVQKDQIMRCASIAETRAVSIVDLIKGCIAKDGERRTAGEKVGFGESIAKTRITSMHRELNLEHLRYGEPGPAPDESSDLGVAMDTDHGDSSSPDIVEEGDITVLGPGTATTTKHTEPATFDISSSESDDDIVVLTAPKSSNRKHTACCRHRNSERPVTARQKKRDNTEPEFVELSSGGEEEATISSSDGEEETTVMLAEEDRELMSGSRDDDEDLDLTSTLKPTQSRGWYKRDSFGS